MAIVRVALPIAVDQLFDYWLPAGLAVRAGSVVIAMLGQRRFVGVAVELVENSELAPEKLIPVEEVLASIPPLSDDLRALARFVASYYHEPIGLCFAQLLPPLGQARTVRAPLADRYRLSATGRAIL